MRANNYSPNNYPADFIANSYNQSPNNELMISFPSPTHALAIDYGGLGFSGVGTCTISLSNGHVFTATLPTVGHTKFVGFTSADPITSLRLVTTNDAWVLEDLIVASQGPQGTPVTIPRASMTSIGLSSAGTYKLNQEGTWRIYEDVAILALLNAAAKMAASTGLVLSSDDYIAIANQARTRLDANPPDLVLLVDRAAGLRYAIDSIAALASTVPSQSFLATVLGSLEKLKIDGLETRLDASRQIPADSALFSVTTTVSTFVSDNLQEACDLAQDNPAYAAATNIVIRDLTGFDTTNSYSEIRQTYDNTLPALNVNNDGTLTITRRGIIDQFNALIGSVQSITDRYLGVPGSDARLSIGTANPDGPCTDRTQSPPCWKDVQETVDSFAKVVRYTPGSDRLQLFNELRTEGNSFIQIGEALQKLATGGFAFNPIASIIGSGGAIFDLFSSGNPVGQQNAAILQQLKRLSQQIATLQQQISSRFDRVDATLNTILSTLVRNFAQIDYQLGVLNGDVHTIQAGLLDVEAQLDRVAQYTLAYLQAISRENLLSNVNGCLNYAVIHTGGNIGQTLYNQCENAFFTWAHDDSSDQLWAGVLQPDYSDANIFGTFHDLPLSVDINYVAQFPQQNLGLPSLTNARIANPNEWVLGARAYLQLAHEWPDYAAQVNSSRLDGLIQVGTNLQQTIKHANSLDGGGFIIPNSPLFNGLAAKYNAAIGSLQTALQSEVDTFVTGLLSGAPTLGFNLWGGVSQSTNYVPQGQLSITPAFGSADAVAAYGNASLISPTNVGTVLANAIRVIDQLGIAKLKLWYTIGNPLVNGGASICVDAYGGIAPCDWLPPETLLQNSCASGVPRSLRVIGTFESGTTLAPVGNIVFDRSGWFCARDGVNGHLGDNISTCRIGPGQTAVNCWQPTIQDWQNNVNGVRSTWTSSSHEVSATASSVSYWLSYWSQVLTSALQTDQSRFYTQVAGDFSRVTQLQSSGQRLTGDKLLLQGYGSLGLPRSSQTNEVLHSLLFGQQSVFDASMIAGDFARFADSLTDITDNKITDELGAAASRLSSLNSTLSGILAQIGATQRPESIESVDVTLEDLRAFRTLKDSGALIPCVYNLSGERSAFVHGDLLPEPCVAAM